MHVLYLKAGMRIRAAIEGMPCSNQVINEIVFTFDTEVIYNRSSKADCFSLLNPLAQGFKGSFRLNPHRSNKKNEWGINWAHILSLSVVFCRLIPFLL